MYQIGLQTYTIRDLLTTPEESRKTFSAVRECGYDFVQIFGNRKRLEADTRVCRELGINVIGAVIMQAIVYALQFLGINPYIQYIIRGLIIILAVSIDVRKYIVKK